MNIKFHIYLTNINPARLAHEDLGKFHVVLLHSVNIWLWLICIMLPVFGLC